MITTQVAVGMAPYHASIHTNMSVLDIEYGANALQQTAVAFYNTAIFIANEVYATNL